MSRPYPFRSSAIVLCGLISLSTGVAQAEKRAPAPIEYAGQGDVPRPNSKASNDPWRGPVTRTGSSSLPQDRQKIQFSYPGSVSTPAPAPRQLASVDASPRAAAPKEPQSLWPAEYQEPARPAQSSIAPNAALKLGAQTVHSSPLEAPAPRVVKPVATGVLPEERGLASWYGEEFDGLPTANGEIFNMESMTAAHKTLPLPSLVQVTNEANGKEIVVRVNDRGPFVDDRIIDLSHRAATALNIVDQGEAPVTVRYLGPAPALPDTNTSFAEQMSQEPVQQASLGTAPAPAPARPDLYGEMLLGGYEPTLGIPDPGKSSATPAQLAQNVAAPAPSVPTPSSPRIVSANLPPVQARPQSIPVSSRPVASASTGFTPAIYVQVGAFADISNAQGMNAQVGGRYAVDIEPVRVHGADYFRVLVGPFTSRESAEGAKYELKARGVSDGFIVVR